jgi:hypothetical protein
MRAVGLFFDADEQVPTYSLADIKRLLVLPRSLRHNALQVECANLLEELTAMCFDVVHDFFTSLVPRLGTQ